jgi:poly(3-hydroxyalkanoate) synthetase
MLKPIANLIEKPINLMENIHRDEFVEDYLYMETWLNDNIPLPGEVYREFAKYLFQQNLLTKNRMPLGRHIVDLRKITCPLLNLMARNDDLVPCSQSEPLNDLVSSTDKEKIIWPAGHIGLAVSGRAQKELRPRAVAGSSSAPIDTRQNEHRERSRPAPKRRGWHRIPFSLRRWRCGRLRGADPGVQATPYDASEER